MLELDLESRFNNENVHTNGTPTHVHAMAIGVGGSAAALANLYRVSPWIRQSLLAIDSDVKIDQDLAMLNDRIHLNADGSFAAIVEHRDEYEFLQDALPDGIKAWQTAQGVGMVRCGASVLFGYCLQNVKDRVANLIYSAMDRFSGDSHKKLQMHIVFSCAGGTGSSLAIPTAMVVRDTVASISETLDLDLIGHCIGPFVFERLLSTPAERERGLANAAMTFRELYALQDPDREDVRAYTQSLVQNSNKVPLFDEIQYYDIVDGGHGIQDLQTLWRRIAVNIAASRNNALFLIEGARKVNPAAAHRGTSGDLAGTSIIATTRTTMARLPIEKLTDSCAGAMMLRVLSQLTDRPKNQGDETLYQRVRHRLRLIQIKEQIQDQCKPIEHLLADTRRSEAEIRTALKSSRETWEGRGKTELNETVRNLADPLSVEAKSHAEDAIRIVQKEASSLSEYISALQLTRKYLVRCRDRIEIELENDGRTKVDLRHEEAYAEFETVTHHRWPRRSGERISSAIEQVRHTYNQSIVQEGRRAAYRLYVDSFLEPILSVLAAAIQNAEKITRQLPDVVTTLHRQIGSDSLATSTLGDEFTEVIKQHEYAGLVEELVDKILARADERFRLNVGALLTSSGQDTLRSIAQDKLSDIHTFIKENLTSGYGNIEEFATSFKLSFKIEEWLKENMAMLLPSRFNLAVLGGSGNSPVRGFIVADESLRRTVQDLIGITKHHEFEFVPSPNAYEVVVRTERTRVPFSAIPNIGRIESSFRNFMDTHSEASDSEVWARLESHNVLRTVAEIDVVPSRLSTGRRAESSNSGHSPADVRAVHADIHSELQIDE